MSTNETTGAAEPRNDAPDAAANETPKQDEFDRLASLPDRHEIRIVIAEEASHASLALRHEDFGKPGELAGVLADLEDRWLAILAEKDAAATRPAP